MTSCDEDTITQILNILTQLNQGEQLYFEGASTVKHCTRTSADDRYTYNPNGAVSFSSHGLNMAVSNGQAAIALGDFSVEGTTLTNVDFPAVTYNNGTIGDSDMQYVYSVSATITKDGQSQTVSTQTSSSGEVDYPYAFATGTVNSSGTLTLDLQIHLSDYECYIITYKGASKTNQ